MEDRLIIFFDVSYDISDNLVYGRPNAVFLSYADEIAKHFDKTTLFVTARENADLSKNAGAYVKIMDLREANFEVVVLPSYSSMATSLPYVPRVGFCFLKHLKKIMQAQALLIRLPSINGLLLAELGHFLHKQVFLSVSTDVEKQANPIVRGGPLKALWIKLARIIHFFNILAARHAVVLAVGQELATKFAEGIPSIPPPLAALNIPDVMFPKDWLWEREDTCSAGVVKLLRVCELTPHKGVDILLESAQILKRRGIQFELQIVGSGPPDYQQELVKLTERLGLTSQVRFLGPVEYTQLREVYLQADIHVLSSLGEGVPRVILESWAVSTPLVATAVGGIPGIVEHEKNGLLVPPGDAEALAAAIERVISHGELRRTLIKNGFAFASELSRERQAEKTAAIIKQYSVSPKPR